MIGVVLSGGGNRGALEAGALIALFEHGIKPDILVGTSAGAMNSAFLATDPTFEGARKLADIWRAVKREDIFPGNLFSYAARFITGADSLSSNDNLRKFVTSHLPPGFSTFGDIKDIKLYLTTSNINTAEIFLWGDDPAAALVEAVLSSAAAPPLLPPIEYDGFQYVDGAVCADVPISICIDRGATEVYAIDVGLSALVKQNIHGIVNLVTRAIGVMEHQQLIDDLFDVKNNTNVTLHYLPIQSFPDVGDFDHGGEFVEEGYRLTKQFLESGAGIQLPAKVMEAPAPPGARKWQRKR